MEALTLHNFQGHERLRIELDPAITTITGPTDAGKSSVIRALKWLALNQPSGADFVRHDAKAAVVALTVDGRSVKRKRGAGVNAYRLDAKTFKAFGADVPDEIAAVLKLGEVNFQEQHDRDFWFHLSPGEVSRRLNAIIDLGSIDEAQSRLASKVRTARSAVDFTKQRLDDSREACKKLEYVPDFLADVEQVDTLHKKWEACALQEARLSGVVGVTHELKKDCETLLELPDFSQTDAEIAELAKLQRRTFRLDAAVSVLEGLESLAKESAREASVAHTAFHLRTKGEACPLCGNHFK